MARERLLAFLEEKPSAGICTASVSGATSPHFRAFVAAEAHGAFHVELSALQRCGGGDNLAACGTVHSASASECLCGVDIDVGRLLFA